MNKSFYVDAAHSIISRTGKKYWKCSVVEAGKNILNFANSKAQWAIEAEAFTILKTTLWLVEQKQKGTIQIFTDCLPLTSPKFSWKPSQKSQAGYFIQLTKKIAQQNHLQLSLRWIKGHKNPADYYSRHSVPKKAKPLRGGTSL